MRDGKYICAWALAAALTSCGGSKGETVDISGAWDGVIEVENDVPTRIRLEIPTDEINSSGTWEFTDLFGRGESLVQSAQPGSVVIRFDQTEPCIGNYMFEGAAIGTSRMQGTFSGSDCDRTIRGDARFDRDATDSTDAK